MNEKIRELSRLADVHILPDDSEYGHCIIGLEKFAELIVKECVTIANEYDAPKLSGPGMMIGSMIENHFGVE